MVQSEENLPQSLAMGDGECLNGARLNGGAADGVKTPFLIGVAGGTASGKVGVTCERRVSPVGLLRSLQCESKVWPRP